jgi:magnesium chelatase subunit D
MSLEAEVQASLAASMFAVDAKGFGGVCIRSPAIPLRDQWLELLRELLPTASTVRKIPCNIADSRLLGGLDLVATLRANRPVAERGVLASIDGGVLVLAMAERLSAHTAALLCNALEQGEIHVAREGVVLREATRIGIIALDEGISEDEFTPRCVLDRCAFLLDFTQASPRTRLVPLHDRAQIDAARVLLPNVTIETTYLQALCATAMALGAGSLRVSVLAVRAARVLAALDGRSSVTQEDAEYAGRMVLAPRASVMPETANQAAQQDPAPQEPPAAEQAKSEQPAPPPPAVEQQANPGSGAAEPVAATDSAQPSPPSDESAAHSAPADLQQVQDQVMAATQSAIPSGLLSQIRAKAGAQRSAGGATAGRFGALRKGGARGRPTGVAPAGAERSRLNVIETLRAAAPWQRVRGRKLGSASTGDATGGNATRLQIRPEDLRVTRYKQRSRTLTIFAVDASGSSALHRLAETKGAAELLLADCYVRRDQVAVIAFRGRTADVLLPPTRSLVRAKRSLSALPGGGGTPLAAAIDAAALMASQAQRRGESPTVVMLTDGRGNVARDGRTGREAGQADATRAAKVFGGAKISALFVDTSPRPHDLARSLARAMSATYVPLPFADAASLSKLVGAANSRR